MAAGKGGGAALSGEASRRRSTAEGNDGGAALDVRIAEQRKEMRLTERKKKREDDDRWGPRMDVTNGVKLASIPSL